MLTNPEARRALRSGIQAIVALAGIAGLWWLIDLLRSDTDGLKMIAKGALILVGIGTVGYQMENGVRAFKLSAGKDGVTIEGNGNGE